MRRQTFTFQYASIKPFTSSSNSADRSSFTFQYASIKPPIRYKSRLSDIPFTFQYASIKPDAADYMQQFVYDLHFNMLLLNR